jgi:hypothetical protein
MLVLANRKLRGFNWFNNLESGKVLTRLIGLEILELKETAARAMYNEFQEENQIVMM